MGELPAILQGLTIGGAGVWVLVIIAITTAIKSWPILRKAQLEADGSFRHDLIGMVRVLRDEVAAERKSCDDRIAQQEARHQAEIERLENQVKGLARQFKQVQLSTGRAGPLSNELNRAFPIPDDMAESLRKLDGEK